jgi:hypothetical protein
MQPRAFLLCPHRYTGGAAGHIATVFEPHKDPVRRGIKRHVAGALNEDPKGRRRVDVNRRRHTAVNRRNALTCGRVGPT